MKILVVSQYYWPEPFRVHEICEALASRGHEVTVLTTFPCYPEGKVYNGYSGKDNSEEEINGVKVIRVKSRPRGDSIKTLAMSYLSYAHSANRYVSRIVGKAGEMPGEYDVVYIYQMSPVTMAIPAITYSKKHKVPTYLYCLDIWPESIREFVPSEKSLLFRATGIVSKWIYNRMTCIGVTTRYFGEYLTEICGVPCKKIKYNPQHAIDIGLCPKETCSEDGRVHFCYTGNIGETQRVDLFVKAAEKLRIEVKRELQDGVPFVLDIVGTGSKYEEVRQYVEEHDLQDTVIMHGRHAASEMPEFYKKADVCLLMLSGLTLAGKTIPGKLQGYLSAGKPVIAAIEGDAVELIRKNQCGIVIPPDDLEALTEAMREYIINKNMYVHCGEKAHELYKREFTLDIHIARLEKELMALCNTRKKQCRRTSK